MQGMNVYVTMYENNPDETQIYAILKTALKLFLLNNNDTAQDLFRKKNVESEKRWYKMNL